MNSTENMCPESLHGRRLKSEAADQVVPNRKERKENLDLKEICMLQKTLCGIARAY